MKFEKAPPYIVEIFEAALATTAGTRRMMFSYPAGFRDGHMFCGVFGKQIFVRLAEPEREKLLAMDGAENFAPMAGRPMREYVVLPADLIEDERAMRGWFGKAFEFAGSLPPKKAAKAKAPAKKKAPARKR